MGNLKLKETMFPKQKVNNKEMKVCTRCLKSRLVSEFYKQSRLSVEPMSRCKLCINEQSRIRRAK